MDFAGSSSLCLFDFPSDDLPSSSSLSKTTCIAGTGRGLGPPKVMGLALEPRRDSFESSFL